MESLTTPGVLSLDGLTKSTAFDAMDNSDIEAFLQHIQDDKWKEFSTPKANENQIWVWENTQDSKKEIFIKMEVHFP